MPSAVVDETGRHLIVYHGTQGPFTGFDHRRIKKEGVHFGTEAQAKMRSGPKGQIVPAVLDIRDLGRARDKGGSWAKVIAMAKKAGYDGLVYLNRYEGINRRTVLRAMESKVDLDKLTDTELRNYAPELTESFIAFYPEQITLLS